MANYYTYGTVPDIDETLYGTSVNYAGLGFPELADRGLPEEDPVGPSPLSLAEESAPVDRPLLEEPYYGLSEEYNEPATLPSRREDSQPAPPPLTSLTSSGDTVPTYIPPGLEAAFLRMRGQSPEQLAAKAEATAQTKPQREVLSELLKAGQFDQAFKYAKDQGVQNLLIDPTELKALRGPFSNDEMKSFFAAMPKDLMGEQDERAIKFTPDKALDQSLQVASIPREGIAAGPLGDIIGYPDVQRAFEPQQLVKEPNAFDKLIKAAVYAGLAFAGGSALSGLGGVSGAGASGAGALTGVTPTGLVPGTTAAKLAAASAGAAGGVAAAPLAEVVITASKFGLTIPQAAALVSAGATGAGALSSGTGAPATAATTPTQPPLEEVVVTGNRAIDPSLLRLVPGSLASANLIQGMTDIPTDIYGQVEGQPDLTEGKLDAIEAQQPKEPFKDILDEVIVTGSKYKPGLLDLATIGTGGLTAAEILKGFTEPALRPYEELPPEVEVPTEEVVVTGTRPPPIDLTKIGLGGLTAAQIAQGFTQPKVDPLTGEPKEPPKTEQELDKIQEALKTGTTIPGTETALDKLKKIFEQYGTVENVIKLLGALGSAGAGGGASGGTGLGVGGGLGGTLPKYTYTRKPLSPAIDYYTYGTRPEAQFFEQGLQLEAPTQPELPQPQLPPARPPGDEPVMAQGGLMGYADGGSKESRYVDGPGSGREDKIPALLSDGEYVMDAETLALLGDGSTKEGARRMDQFRANIRKHKGRALSRGQISPDAKSPEKHMGGGLS